MTRLKIMNRDPPDWQNQKLMLAREIVKELKEINKKLEVIEYEVSIKR